LAFKFRAEFPNDFGWNVSKQRTDFRPIAIRKEFCPTCEAAFARRVALLKLDPNTK
jgi:hypothetical protein